MVCVLVGVYLLAPQASVPGQRVVTSGEHSSDIGSRNSELHNLRASSSSYSASPPAYNMPTQVTTHDTQPTLNTRQRRQRNSRTRQQRKYNNQRLHPLLLSYEYAVK